MEPAPTERTRDWLARWRLCGRTNVLATWGVPRILFSTPLDALHLVKHTKPWPAAPVAVRLSF